MRAAWSRQREVREKSDPPWLSEYRTQFLAAGPAQIHGAQRPQANHGAVRGLEGSLSPK
ncbi:MAG: hypothetical protein ACJ79X_12600 [Gemmatimonadaceae bacterium]